MHDSVEVPEPPVMLVGPKLHVMPVAGDVVPVRPTVALKPLTLVTVMVEVPVPPAIIETLVGLAWIVKSGSAVTSKITSSE